MIAYLYEGVNQSSFIRFLFWRVLAKVFLEFHRFNGGENSFKQGEGKRQPKANPESDKQARNQDLILNFFPVGIAFGANYQQQNALK